MDGDGADPELLAPGAERLEVGRVVLGEAPRAGRLRGVAAALREAIGHPVPPTDAAERERRLIELALKRAGGNQSKAAEMLGVWRPRLIRRIKALGIDAT